MHKDKKHLISNKLSIKMNLQNIKKQNFLSPLNQSKTLVLQSDSGQKNHTDSDLDVMDQIETQEPPLYKVLILNDDYTPMDFVVYVLKTFFKHDDISAEKIMMDVHKQGSGVAGIYTFEIAETKSMQVNQFAKSNKYPLKSTVEEEA